jgi:2-hydroxy-3-oxopropionate reductase
MLKIGYIGLGIMGKSIARNIMKAGFPIVVHNRSRAAVQELVKEGAREYGALLPATAAAAMLFDSMLQTGMAEWDNSGVVGVIEALSVTKLQEN